MHSENIFDSREDQMSFLRQVLSYLPDVHRDTLAELCDTFYYVLSSTSVAENKYEFAYVFGTLFWRVRFSASGC